MRNIFAIFIFISSLICSSLAIAGPKVEFKTNLGSFVVELDSVKAPKTTANFLNYVNSGFYNGTIFHRVIDGFMIQGGGLQTSSKSQLIHQLCLKLRMVLRIKHTRLPWLERLILIQQQHSSSSMLKTMKV